MILKLRTRKALVAGLATLALLLTAGLYAIAQQAMDESKRDRAVAVQGGKYHLLPATLETTQWGWLDPKEPPKLVVNSGDTVAVETMMSSGGGRSSPRSSRSGCASSSPRAVRSPPATASC